MNQLLSRAIRRLYDSRVGDLAVKMGLRDGLRNTYANILYHTSGNEKKVTIGGTTAVLGTETPRTAFEVHQNLLNESPIIRDFLGEATSKDIFYDIGAGFGSYSCFVSQEASKTFAFEPDLERYETLCDNIKRNGIDATALNVAIGEVTGAKETNDDVDATVVNGDEYLSKNELPLPDLLKIDVDGPELHVLRGMSEGIGAGPRLIWIEAHPNRLKKRGHSIKDIKNHLDSYGYEASTRNIEGLKSPFIRASR